MQFKKKKHKNLQSDPGGNKKKL